jgi:hypothetical protein
VDAHPRLIPWNRVGDGSIFGRIPPEEATKAGIFGDSKRARSAYGHSIQYSMRMLFSYVQRYGNDKNVLIVLGDHQAATTVSGEGVSPTCRSR